MSDNESSSEQNVTPRDVAGQQPQGRQHDPVPDDHPLARTLDAQKTELKDLRAKAKRLEELEEAQKSETEKAADRIAKAEAETASVPAKVADALKAHLVELHSIDAEDAELFLTAADPDLLLKQVTRLIGQSGTRKKNHVPNEGNTPSRPAKTDAEFASQLFGG